jgi:uncharacterized 2Fe-2S/4Fe-4S cluster protein (DUF4445 family)
VNTIQESANNIVASTIQLLTTGQIILDRVDEVGFNAVDQIEDTKNSAKTIEESANNIVCGATELVDIGKTIFTTGEKILDRVDKVKFTERFDEVEKLGTESVKSNKTILNGIEDTKKSVNTIQESANNIVASTIQLLTTGQIILDRVDEVGFKERFDEVEKLQKRNFRLSIGIIIGLLGNRIR